ncbi:MAG TPA: hypothetical protein VFM35_05800 [Candidatus Binatia bacterium]|nr:hypothetical protein [Candidatus Binatia bacterium]
MGVRFVLLAFLLASLAISVPATSAERQGDEGRDRKVERKKKDVKEGQYSDRDRRADWGKEKEALERALKAGEGKDFYRRELVEKMGYTITAVNYDKPDYIEYEIVKGNNTYEIQINFDKNSNKATKVDVTTNMWKADVTKQVLKGQKTKAAKGDARYSDRDHRADWGKGKEALEQSLKTGEDKAFYRKELEKQGYKITSVNYDKPDYVEYEVVKGDQSYEVQIDLDKNTGKAKKIDVTTNMWQAEATERALEANRQRASRK